MDLVALMLKSQVAAQQAIHDSNMKHLRDVINGVATIDKPAQPAK